MRRRFMLAGLLAVIAAPARAQTALLDSLTQADASRGVRDALGLAAVNATARLARPNGFFGDNLVRIPLPGLLGQAQSSLRGLGMAGPLDDLQANINHAAESTMLEAGGLFANAIRTMTLGDAINIVRGPQNAATLYLRDRTGPRLTTLLKPPMTEALTRSGAFTLLRSVAREYHMTAMANDLRRQTIDFSTEKALDGAFYYIAQEEAAIRRDPVRRTTDILRRVFG